MLLRFRIASFLTGFGLASAFALYQLRKDIWDSHRILLEQVKELLSQLAKRSLEFQHTHQQSLNVLLQTTSYTANLEGRVTKLEAEVAQLKSSSKT
jgi:hypothetical protein